MLVSKERRKALLGKETSRRNKMALLAQYYADGEQIKHQWSGKPYESRLMVSFDGGDFYYCKSYDEDVRPFLEGRD